MRIYLIDQLNSERRVTYNLFLRMIGCVYFCAFFSLVFQIRGLLGSDGILPVSTYLAAVQQNNGFLSYIGCPTLFWFSCDNTALYVLTISGCLLAICMMAGRFLPLCALFLYIMFLSITSVGQEFLSYQWDMLLLQVGFLAIIASLLKPDKSKILPALVTAFFFYLNFRLIFSSGVCKIASGDPTWANLTALLYHFNTQPLPTPLAIFANAMPEALSKVVCLLTLGIELLIPFFIWLPRRCRLAAAIILALLQAAIALTGNYGFFNLLSAVILLPLLDDDFLARTPLQKFLAIKPEVGSKFSVAGSIFGYVLSAIVLFNCLAEFSGRLFYEFAPAPLRFARAMSQTCGISNSYGLFAVMTLERPEIIVEGSDDGINYRAYQFRYKVSRPEQAPPIVAPNQPRLDWQMWFESLNATYGEPFSARRGLNPSPSPWFIAFLTRLSEGDRAVLDLLASNPFKEKPPKYLRARVVNYTMASPTDLLATGRWWKTAELGTYVQTGAGFSGH
ncbi:MAG: lipase maturation factor family protein [Cyanobacteria bacterium SZAS TMP-1]|nr:lipase maturation factor family protein [Cyanobacteria bacterium SZAS TMP-1]